MAWIGIDLGGTKVQAVVVDVKGSATPKVTAEGRRKTPAQGGPLAVVDALAAVVEELGGAKQADGVGVGAPGVVEPRSGVVRQAPNLAGWLEPFGLAGALSDALDGLPVVVDNDVNVATLAELRMGTAVGVSDLLGVFVGTGVGGALVLDGTLRRGPNGQAGEIGHTVVKPGGRLCGCGGRGHLESYAGRGSMERRAREADAREPNMLVELAKGKRITSSVFAKALAGGDPLTVRLLDEAVDALGVAIASAVTLLDLNLVVVGGGLADRLGHVFVGRVEQACRSRLFAASPRLRVLPAALGDQGGAIGAALMGASRESEAE